MSDTDDPLRAVRLGKLESLRAQGIDPYPYSFARNRETAELERIYAELPAGSETSECVRVAGRIRAIRNSGMFIDLHDASGKIQIFCHRDNLSADGLAVVRLLDIGDLIGAQGLVRRTSRGELTVNAAAVTVLAKALRPLPEKYHGLADIELRYRQRYLDLIMNQGSRETLRRRSRVVAAMRSYLVERGEFRVVPRRDALVAEAAIDLEQLVGKPADQEPLQVQLGCDPQIEVDVERVVMRDKGARGGAAGDRVQ